MLKAFIRSPSGLVGLAFLLLIALVAIFAPIFLTHQANAFNINQANQGSSWAHLLGTDQLGHDTFDRLLVSTRLAMLMPLAAVGIGLGIGIPLGAVAAMLPGRSRAFALRAIDALIAFPALLIAIIVVAIMGAGVRSSILGVGLAFTFSFARVSSSLTLAVRDREYIAAAKVIGVRGWRLIVRQVMPNIADTLAINAAVSVAGAIVTIAGLSFLGLGVQTPTYDWGSMLTQGLSSFYTTPAAALGPAAAIALAAIAFGFVGEAFARAMNPLLWANVSTAAGYVPVDVAVSVAQASVPVPEQKDDQQLVVRDLRVTFPINKKTRYPIVDGVSIDLSRGEIVGIVGESGSGKTMTAMAIAQLVPYPGKVTGSIELGGQDLQALPLKEVDKVLGSRLAVVFQDPMSALNPALRIGTQLTEGVKFHRHLTRKAAAQLAVSRLEEVALPTPERQMRRYPHEMSGGQRQRVLIAMGLMNDPVLLIADEPTTALDVTIQAQIMDVLAEINRTHGTSILLISHNLGLVAQNCHRVLVMYAGRVVEELTTDQLHKGALHPYTKALLGAVPDMTRPRSEPLVSIPGHMPSPTSLPAGCPFHPRRCAFAEDRCKVERPPLVACGEDDRKVACWVAMREVSAGVS